MPSKASKSVPAADRTSASSLPEPGGGVLGGEFGHGGLWDGGLLVKSDEVNEVCRQCFVIKDACLAPCAPRASLAALRVRQPGRLTGPCA